MNTVLKVGVAGALALAGVAAHASIPSPSNASADAILFGEVLNAAGTAVVASYAGDTGVSINTLLSGTYTNTVLASDSNLSNLFKADVQGDQLVWAVQGAQNTSGSNPPTFVTTTQSTTKLKSITNANLSSWAAGFTSDVSVINSNAGGLSSIEGASAPGAGVWDVSSSTSNIGNWYASMATSQVLGAATAPTLYSEVTTSATKGASAAIETVNLTQSGLSFAGLSSGNPPPVPLPAAVWLLGSGLLGLTGVARRKSKA